MTKRMLISVDEEESRVAIIDSRRLENLEIEAKGGEGRRGNIYKGVVHKVEPSLQAAFIDFGEEKQGFLPLSEVHRRLWPKGITDKRPDISLLLKEKQELMVQVVKDEIGTKGATLTTFVSLPSRYLILMPESDKSGISRRLGDTERRRLKEVIAAISVPDGFGVIIRTAGQQQRPMELKKDLLYLTKLYESIESNFSRRQGAGLIYKDRSHAVRFIRDYFTDDVDEIWCNNRSTLKEIGDFMSVLMPVARQTLRLYEGTAPLFVKFAVEDQVESVFAREVPLPNGGSIVIDQTEALVAVDVNSGKVKGQDIEETALKTNLEAAHEVARQVKIRDMGGLIVVDFIDMRERKNVRHVETELRKAFTDDKSKIKFGRISQFGLMELSRQRLRKSLMTQITRRCEACDGTGQVRAPASAGLSLLRRIEEACLRGNVKYIRATTSVGIANLLLNRRRGELSAVEQKMGTIVEVVGHKDMPANLVALDVVVLRGGRSAPQRIYQLLDLIRNKVIRKDTSPLPRPEEGLEKLELDHGAIYRMIAARDEEMAKAEELSTDFEFSPQEPDLESDEASEESDATNKRRRRRRRRRKKSDADYGDGGDSQVSVRGADAGDDNDAATDDEDGDSEHELSPEEKEEMARQDERRRGGFVGWMKRIFGGEGDDAQPDYTDVSDAAIGAIEPPATSSDDSDVASTEVESVSTKASAEEGTPSEDSSANSGEEQVDGEKRRRRRRRRRRKPAGPKTSADTDADNASDTDIAAADSAEASSVEDNVRRPAEGKSTDAAQESKAARPRRKPRRTPKSRAVKPAESEADALARDAARAVAALESAASASGKSQPSEPAAAEPPPIPTDSEG